MILSRSISTSFRPVTIGDDTFYALPQPIPRLVQLSCVLTSITVLEAGKRALGLAQLLPQSVAPQARAMFKKVSAATSAFFKPSPADEGRSNVAASWSAGKRRALQSMGGASKATPDAEYAARRERLDTHRIQLAGLVKAASAHVDAMRSLAFTATEMGAAASALLGDATVSDIRSGASIETWARPLAGLDASMAARDVHRLVDTVIKPLQAELSHIDTVVASKGESDSGSACGPASASRST